MVCKNCGNVFVGRNDCLSCGYDPTKDDPNFVVEVIAPKEKKKYRYKTASATERFFMDNRIDDLEEVN